MSKYYLFQDEKKCISCRSCQVQCKINKGLGVGPKPNQVIDVGPVKENGRYKAKYVFLACFHCDNPWCIPACPNGAMQKRESDGVIYIEQERCVGCKSCIMACPWSAPQWDGKKGKVVKCDFCKDRLDAGLKPACVTACPTDCLDLVPTEKLPDTKRVRFIKELISGEACS